MIASIRPSYAYLVGVAALALLTVTAVANAGCTGPPSPVECDFIRLAEQAAEPVHPFSPYAGRAVLDRGSSVYVHQPERSHEAGALIDKRSCRVCRVDYYSTAIAEFLLFPGESNGKVLQYEPPALSPAEGPPDILRSLGEMLPG